MTVKIPVRLGRSKYGNVRCELDGLKFASKKEMGRYAELKLLERAGQIQDVEVQPRFLIEVRGVKVCTYVADFRYWERQPSAGKVNLKLHIEDVKSPATRTRLYLLKKKLAQLTFNIVIEEI